MVPLPLSINLAIKPFLVHQQPQGVIPDPLEVFPHHEAILVVGEDKTIIVYKARDKKIFAMD